MMRSVLILLSIVGAITASAQQQAWRDSCEAFWARTDSEFADPKESPLGEEDRAAFTHVARYPYDPHYHVVADFTPSVDAVVFDMPTTTARRPEYKAYGTARFTLDGRTYTLTIYQNLEVMTRPGFANYLFLPFTDLTNGSWTYGGGRYLDLTGPFTDKVELDFNKAYNPYCAYNTRYSCPIPPKENHLAGGIKAGALKFGDH